MRRTIEIAAFLALLLVTTLATHAWLASRDEQQRLASTLAAQKQILDSADARERSRDANLNATLAQIAKLKRDTQSPEQILRDLPKYLPLPQPISLDHPEASASNSQPLESGAPEKETDASAQKGTRSSEKPTAGLEKQPAQSPPGLLGDHSAQIDQRAAECGKQRDSSARKGSSLSPACSSPSASPQEIGSDVAAPVTNQQGTRPPTLIPSSDDCPGAKTCNAQIPVADLKPLYDYVQDCRACQARLAAAKQDAADNAVKLAAVTRERDAAVTASKGGSFLRRLRRNALWFAIGAASGYAAAKR